MNGQVVPPRPRGLHRPRGRHVGHPRRHVELHQPVHTGGVVGEGGQLGRRPHAHVADVAEPRVQERSVARWVKGGGNARAGVVADNEDVANAQDGDGKLNDGQAVEVLGGRDR